MKTVRKDIITAISAVLGLTLLLGILYPLVITGVGQVAFPGNANGQLVRQHGHVVGSKEIGQQYTDLVYKNGKVEMSKGEPVTTPDPHYFQTRPSGTTPADNAEATTFGNYGPNDVATEQQIASNAQAYLQLNRPYDPGLTTGKLPVDAVDTSASGIDPDISPANADIQAHRVAAVDHIPLSQVTSLINRYTGQRGLGFSGQPSVNVMQLNLAIQKDMHA